MWTKKKGKRTLRKRDKVRTVESEQRYGEDLPETIVHLDPETGMVQAFGDMKTFTLNERKKAVLDVVGSDPPLTEADMRAPLTNCLIESFGPRLARCLGMDSTASPFSNLRGALGQIDQKNEGRTK